MRLSLPRALLALAAFLALRAPAQAQEAPVPQPEAVRVFIGCSGFFCDHEYFQTEIAWVTHVRERRDADVHVLITQEATAGAGSRYTLAFLGQGRFHGTDATLTHVTEAGESGDRVREGLANAIRLGLVRYAAETPLGPRLRVSYEAPTAAADAATERDPWNYWTFTLRGNGFFSGETSYSNRWLNGSATARRVTADWKISFGVDVSEDHSEFEIDSVTTFTSRSTSRTASALVVRSLGSRLSAGVRASASRSTYFNQDAAISVAPAVEYNLFPYSQSTRRQLTLQYSVGPRYFDYEEETIFGKTEETLLNQALAASVVFRQPWGSTNVTGQAASYLHDPKRNRLTLGGAVELNLLRGFALSFAGDVQRVRDQLYLSAEGATEEEILLRRRALATSFQYFAHFGVSYTFGSKLSTIVNPRFGGGSGGGITIVN